MPALNLPPFVILHVVVLLVNSFRYLLTSTKPVKGILYFGIGAAYVSTCYVPIEQNQFLYASVPVRLAIAAICAVKVLVSGRSLSSETYQDLVISGLWDGIWACQLGYELGTFSGRIPGY